MQEDIKRIKKHLIWLTFVLGLITGLALAGIILTLIR